MVLLDLDAHAGQVRDHLGPHVVHRIDRRHRHVAALRRRAVPHVALFVGTAGVVGPLLLVEHVVGLVHRDLEAHVVEHEELGLRPEVGGVPEPGIGQIDFRLLGHAAGAAFIGLPGGGFDHVAGQDQLRQRRERVHHRARRVRHEDHVRLVNLLPARDRGAVEHDPVGEHVLVHRADRLGHVLPLAARVGEPEVHELDLVLLDRLQDAVRIAHRTAPSPARSVLCASTLSGPRRAGALIWLRGRVRQCGFESRPRPAR